MKYITLKMLEDWGACPKGIRLFKRLTKTNRLAVTRKGWLAIRHYRKVSLYLKWVAASALKDSAFQRMINARNAAHAKAWDAAGGYDSVVKAGRAADTAFELVMIDHIVKYGK